MNIAETPVYASEACGRTKIVAIPGQAIFAHPLMIIEIAHADDLNSRSAAALEWIQQRAERRAAAAIARIEAMHQPAKTDDLTMPAYIADELKRSPIRNHVFGEGNYLWPDHYVTAEVAGR